MKKRVLFGTLIILSRIPVLSQPANQDNGANAIAQTFADGWVPIISGLIAGLCFIMTPLILWHFISKNKQWKPYKGLMIVFFIVTIIFGITYFIDAALFWSGNNTLRIWS